VASPGTRVKDRTELKDRLAPPACRSSRPQPKRRKKKGGGSLNKADNTTLARAGELPTPPRVTTQGCP
jgi:hypothetical protein